MEQQWSDFDLVEGFHLAHAVFTLHSEGILNSLAFAQTAEQLAVDLGLDPEILKSILQYVATRTNLVKCEDSKFYLTDQYTTNTDFLFNQYIGAYGPNAHQLSTLLRDPTGARNLVNRQRHANAFEHASSPAFGIIRDLVVQLELNYLLDLGCGPCVLLKELAERNANFVGWGMDSNLAMCSGARERLLAAGLYGQISVLNGDCANLAAAIPLAIQAKVETLSAASLLNEFFGCGDDAVIDWLKDLRSLFPGRALIVSDYYGRLGYDLPSPRRTILHDFVQVISGQGVPPPDRTAWIKIYAKAGCKLLHIVEDEEASFFVHIILL